MTERVILLVLVGRLVACDAPRDRPSSTLRWEACVHGQSLSEGRCVDECCAIALAPGLERREVELDQPFATRCVRGR